MNALSPYNQRKFKYVTLVFVILLTIVFFFETLSVTFWLKQNVPRIVLFRFVLGSQPALLWNFMTYFHQLPLWSAVWSLVAVDHRVGNELISYYGPHDTNSYGKKYRARAQLCHWTRAQNICARPCICTTECVKLSLHKFHSNVVCSIRMCIESELVC